MAFAKHAERRAFERSKVAVAGRLMLADRRECVCTIVDVSRTGISLFAQQSGAVGEAVVLYVDRIGRLQGEIVRHFEGGFGLKLTGNSRAGDELVERFAGGVVRSA